MVLGLINVDERKENNRVVLKHSGGRNEMVKEMVGEQLRVDHPREQVVKGVKALQTKTKKEELMRMMGEGRSVMERLKRESTSSLWMSG